MYQFPVSKTNRNIGTNTGISCSVSNIVDDALECVRNITIDSAENNSKNFVTVNNDLNIVENNLSDVVPIYPEIGKSPQSLVSISVLDSTKVFNLVKSSRIPTPIEFDLQSHEEHLLIEPLFSDHITPGEANNGGIVGNARKNNCYSNTAVNNAVDITKNVVANVVVGNNIIIENTSVVENADTVRV